MEANSPLDSVGMPATLDYEYAPIWKRFVTFLIDYVIVALIAIVVVIAVGMRGSVGIYVAFYGSKFVYYAIMEYAFGRTIGKFVIGTTVVRENDLEKISMGQALGRSICRFVPFEPFSFLGSVRGWHDSWTNTIVVDANSVVKR